MAGAAGDQMGGIVAFGAPSVTLPSTLLLPNETTMPVRRTLARVATLVFNTDSARITPG